jgi:DNA-directed RNA polymerase subunit F
MDIKEERFVTWADAKRILEKKAKEKELGYEQKNALEHLRKFSKLKQKDLDGLMAELSKIERLKEKHRVMIADMLPEDLDQLRITLQNEVVTLSDDDKKKIVSIVKKFT